MLKIYDTTLRDGSQKQGISFSTEDKIRITKELDKLGVDYVEGGWPGSNPKDIEYFNKVKDMKFRNIKIAAFGSTRRANIEPEDDHNLKEIIKSGVKVATIFGKTWDLHVTVALNTTLEENLKMIESSIKYLKDRGLEVIFDAEHFFDGYKANKEYALKVIDVAVKANADSIVFCDTNGGTLPCEVRNIIKEVKPFVTCEMGIHAHNDSEVAVANSLIAFEEGITQIQGTINGYGERCGNASLSSIIPNIILKYDGDLLEKIKLRKITEVSRFVSELINASHPSNLPFVGSDAFTHKGGIHVSAILKDIATYEHINPILVGNDREVVISELSGKANIIYKAKQLGIDIDEKGDGIRNVVNRIKELEYQGYHFEGADGSFRLLVEKALGRFKELFKLKNARIITEKLNNDGSYSEVSIKVNIEGKEVHTAASGNGPVNALDKALRKALIDFYPEIEKFYLVDYKVRVLDSNDGTEAKVRVLIETTDGNNNWGTVGASTNIIEASWKALVDSIEFGILYREGKKEITEKKMIN
ncbi:citramalate synthase [Clostridiaceae bacterium HSG29]|nr:citramalate synthase [Clostridiaceae bacterium HSG29]